MPFISDILRHRSLSIVGMEKNTGKTEVLNYIINRLDEDVRMCLTSIGIDGETVDQVTDTKKPEIFLRSGVFFSTSEKHYLLRKIVSQIEEISSECTSLGRIVTAKSLSSGNVLLSGPSTTASLRRWMDEVDHLGIDLILIDGALSRMSSASAAVSEAMVLSTGAALSIKLATLVRKTAFQVEMIRLPKTDDKSALLFDKNEDSLMILNDGRVLQMENASAFLLSEKDKNMLLGSSKIYLPGALTDKFLSMFLSGKTEVEREIIVKDFTKLFISEEIYRQFLRNGGRITVLDRTHLIAICINPVSPAGYTLDSRELQEAIQENTGVKTYNIFDR